jgi:acetyl-CoA C-acetyltransferase
MALSKVGVVATAQTSLRSAWSDAQHIDLISSVVSSVFKGTGLTLDDVDFIIDSGSDVLDGRSISNCGFLGALGAHHKEEARVEEDGLWAALYGVNKIRSGASRVGLIVAYSKPSESQVDLFWASQLEPFYQRPVGFGQKAANGLMAQDYMAKWGVTREQLAELVAKRWAAAAEAGLVDGALVPDAAAVLAAEEAAAPLTEMMLARPVDGAVAVLIAEESIAKRAAQRPVYIAGMGTSMATHAFAERGDAGLRAVEAAASMAYRAAGWGAAEADIVELSASSVVGELMAIEALGLAELGQGLAAANGTQKAINASGGALPADPIMATGLVRLAQAVQQLVEPASGAPSRAIVHGSGGVAMQNNCVFALEL